MTRIIAGAARGHTLKVPSSGTRPTSDRVREGIFSRLATLTEIAGARVLDLYAGSGALGLEAASRGAHRVDLVDNSDRAVTVIRSNLDAIRHILPESDVRAHRAGVTTFLATTTESWDIALIDPPYELSNSALVAVLAALVPHLRPDAIVAVERSARNETPVWPEEYGELSPKNYGETRIYWLELPA